MKSLTLILLTAISFSLYAQQPNADQLQEKRRKLQKEIESVKQSLELTRKNRKAGLQELAIMQRKIALREDYLKTINSQIDLIQGNINQSQYEIARLAGELDTLKEQYRKSIVYSYQNKNNLDFANFIFSAGSFTDALKRMEYLKSYREYREEQAAAIRSTQAKIRQKVSGLQLSRQKKDEALEAKEKEVKLFARDKAEKSRLIASLGARENELKKELATKEKADKKLRDGIYAAIAREKKRLAKAPVKITAPTRATTSSAKKTGSEKSTTNTTRNPVSAETLAASTAFEKNKGNLLWPVEGRITERFGRRKVPGLDVWTINYGITLEMNIGAEVQAVFAGEVLSIFNVDGRQAVIISHGKYYTTYSNLQQIAVIKGQQIEAGQLLGRSAANDFGKGQVIFMLTDGKTNLDPENWIRKR